VRAQKFERSLLMATVAGPVLSFAAAPLLAEALGRDGRGTLAAVMSAFLIFRYLSTLGGQEAALAAVHWTDMGVGGTTRAVTRWIGPSSVAFSAVAWIAAPLMFRLDSDAITIFRGLLLVIPLAAISDGLRFALTADQRSRPVVAHILAPHVVRLVGAIAMVTFAIDSVATGAWISVAGSIVGFTAVVAASVPLSRGVTIERSVERRFRRFAWDLAPGQAARLGNRRLDQLLLGSVAGSGELGLYAVAVALAEVADLFTRTIRQLAIRSSNDPDGPDVEHYFRLGVVLLVPSIVLLALTIPLALSLLFPPSFGDALWPAEILLLAGLANYIRDVLGVFLVTGDFARTESSLQIVTLAVAVAAVLLLGWQFGAIGASVATLLAYTTSAALVVSKYRGSRPEARLHLLIPRRADAKNARALVFAR
jgi:O-antigen/teichoic acid export membrane protein